MFSSTPVIRVEDVSKRYELYEAPRDRLKQFILPKLPGARGRRQYYREFWALRNVSLTVQRGESVAIVGRNGSGKSTLLQIITGTLAPTSGQVTTEGRIAALLELGSGFNPDFSGRENVFMNGALLGMDAATITDKFDAIASFADIGPHLDQPVKTYSSGMLLRLAFAVQVQVDPDILIVDEALAVGDALFQKRCLRKLASLVERGTTLLFVSHSQETVRTLTTRALLLDHGTPIIEGATPNVLLEYRRRQNLEEAIYLSAAVRDVSVRARPSGEGQMCVEASSTVQDVSPKSELHPPAAIQPGIQAFPAAGNAQTLPGESSTARDFGARWVEVLGVDIQDGNGQPCVVFAPGEQIRLKVRCRANMDATRLNVAVRVLNKEGVKVYSWGTLNQDMSALSSGAPDELFWRREWQSGEPFEVRMDFECTLGSNLYEVQASVSLEDTPDYMSQHILHWVDEAAFFQVIVKRDEHFFGGVVDLRMRALW